MVKVSVVMPAYNAEKYIRQAVDSILSQTFTDFECIIINDGSTDNTLSILQSYNDKRVEIISRGNAGIVASINEGISIAKGMYIARMDADDISLPTRFAKQVEFLDINKNCVVVGSMYQVIDKQNNFLFSCSPKYQECGVNKLGVLMHYIAQPSMMIKKDSLIKVGGYRKEFHVAEDKDLLYRLSCYGTINNIQESLLKYRRHASSMTASPLSCFAIAYKHVTAYILHLKNGKNNIDVWYKNWTIKDYIHLYVSTFLLGLKIFVFNIIEKHRK